MGTSQLTIKLAFQNIMDYLRLLLFFFVLLAPLQLTSAVPCIDREPCRDSCWRKFDKCHIAAIHSIQDPRSENDWKKIRDAEDACEAKLDACWDRSHFDDDNGDNHDD